MKYEEHLFVYANHFHAYSDMVTLSFELLFFAASTGNVVFVIMCMTVIFKSNHVVGEQN